MAAAPSGRTRPPREWGRAAGCAPASSLACSQLALRGSGGAAGGAAKAAGFGPDAAVVREGGKPHAALTASGMVYSLLALPEGRAAAGTAAEATDLWPDAAAWREGGKPRAALGSSGTVYPLLALPGCGIAAGGEPAPSAADRTRPPRERSARRAAARRARSQVLAGAFTVPSVSGLTSWIEPGRATAASLVDAPVAVLPS